MQPAGTPLARSVPLPADPRPQPKDPFAGLAEQLASVQGQPLAERVTTFTQIHQVLNEALSATAIGSEDSTPQAGSRPDPRGPQPPRPGGR